jgi:hypothetical protein
MRVYGRQPKHWMPAYAGMTSQRSMPAKAGIQEPYRQLQAALRAVSEIGI